MNSSVRDAVCVNTRPVNVHNKREQAIIAAHNQEEGEVGCTGTLLNRCCQDHISDKGNSGARHDMIASFLRTVAVPSLEEHQEPAYDIWRNSHALCIDGRVAQVFDELKVAEVR